MDEVKIRSGTRVRLSRLEDGDLSDRFAAALQRYAASDERIEAVFGFRLQADDREPQPSLAIAIRGGWRQRKDETFINVVEQLQHEVPEDASLNLYRFGASQLLASFCLEHLDPLYVRSAGWLERQRRKS
jgi:hypothetical protein